MDFNAGKLERKKNKEINGLISSNSPFPVYTIHQPLSTCAISFNFVGLNVPEKSVTKIFNV